MKKKRNIIICAAVAVLVIGLVIAAIVTSSMNKKNEEKNSQANVSVDKKNLREGDETQTLSDVETVVELQFVDCAIAVGTQLKMTALVTPENTDHALVWSVGDTSVLDITPEGILTVKAAGMSVVTATVGTVSDSVVIEGIDDILKGSKNDLPVYTGAALTGTGFSALAGDLIASGDNNGGSVGDNNSENRGGGSGGISSRVNAAGNTGNNSSSGENNSPDNRVFGGNDNSDGDDTNTTSGGSAVNPSNGGSSAGGGGSASDGNGSYDGGDNRNSGGNGSADTPFNNNSNTGNGGGSTGGGSSSSDYDSYGFTQRYTNVYVCEVDNTYYGEIITQPNVTIIYIKRRNGYFDQRIQSVLSDLLPESSGQVWSNYLSATSDRTFTAEGRMVRIVVAPNGGHSQIVIYN